MREQPWLFDPVIRGTLFRGQIRLPDAGTDSVFLPVLATIFRKTSLPTNSLIHKYCFCTLGLARASIVNINWNWRTETGRFNPTRIPIRPSRKTCPGMPEPRFITTTSERPWRRYRPKNSGATQGTLDEAR
jgi:hypothetical protein